jgi:hypothetical protein
MINAIVITIGIPEIERDFINQVELKREIN